MMRSTFGRLFNKNWVLVAILTTCGASLLACSSNVDNPWGQQDEYAGVPLIIHDADFGSSTDDLFALEMLYRYEQEGRCRLLGGNHGVGSPDHIQGITGSVLLIIFRSLISLCFITCLIRISFNLKKDQKNRPHDPSAASV